jgi:SAM-dependent methyltransferase
VSGRGTLGKHEGRRLFGVDPAAYDLGRPGHADEVYDVLRERCGLRHETKVLEIGPGTGQATRHLLELGARPLVGIEPDRALAALLRERLGDRVEIRESTLEDAVLEDDFELAVAASSFHWVDEAVGLAKIHDALLPEGWVALWWTAFGGGHRRDPFRDATDPLMEGLPESPSQTKSGRPFAHDGEARVTALERAGFGDVIARRIEWAHTWDTEGIRALFGSFSPVLSLEPDRREAFLDSVAEIAERDYGGRVTKPVVTALYTARKRS